MLEKMIKYLENEYEEYRKMILADTPHALKAKGQEILACKQMIESTFNVKLEIGVGKEIKVKEKPNAKERLYIIAVTETRNAQVAVKATCKDEAFNKAYKKCVDNPEEWESSELEFNVM